MKKPREMNDAFLLKLVWNLVTQLGALWCQVLQGKYERNHNQLNRMITHTSDSPLWKALTGLWEEFHKHIIWKIGNGRDINFWFDKWVPNKGALFNVALAGNNVIDTTLYLPDFITASGAWNIDAIKDTLPSSIVHEITAIPPPMEEDGADSIGWSGTTDANFTTKSAYNLLCQSQTATQGDWPCIWKWRGPHRIQMFMWIVAHGRLLTNSRRHAWNPATSPTGAACHLEDETVMHVLVIVFMLQELGYA